MLVDGGPSGVYEEVLKPRLEKLSRAGGMARILDVVCISHIDQDHIVGVLRLLTEIRRAQRDPQGPSFQIKRLWHNSVEELVDEVEPMLSASVVQAIRLAGNDVAVCASYNQGRDARDLAVALGLGGNLPFDSPITQGCKTAVHGLDVTAIGPSRAALAALARKWRAAKKNEPRNVVVAAYEDPSIPNLSSIAIHLKYGQHSVLMTGDARGDHLLSGLEQVGLLKKDCVLNVDVLKLPHHGSQNNVEPEFFRRVQAHHYVISADGIKHDHPNEDTLEWLVSSRSEHDRYTIHLTNAIPKAEKKLQELNRGRSFLVDVAPASAKACVIELA
jgi:beta-lactamase superfamily II metal-dependent hydrolase